MSVLDPTRGQAQLWLVFAAAGCACALCTGLLSAFFGSGRLRAAGSLASGLASGLIACGACIFFANGNLRAYMLPAMAVGAAAFQLLVGVPLGRAFRLCARAARFLGQSLGRRRFIQRLLK